MKTRMVLARGCCDTPPEDCLILWETGTALETTAANQRQVYAPGRDNQLRLTGRVESSAAAETLVFCAYKDETTYLALKITWSTTCSRIDLVRNGAVLRTVYDRDLTPGKVVEFCAMFDGGVLAAWFRIPMLFSSDPGHYLRASTSVDNAANQAAIGTGTNGGNVKFSNVQLQSALSETRPDCPTCDQCTIWAQPSFVGSIGTALTCEYGGNATYALFSAPGFSNVRTARIPAGGNLSVGLGVVAEPFVAVIQFFLAANPATLTFTVCGINGVLSVAANNAAALGVGGYAFPVVVSPNALYQITLCCDGANTRIEIGDGFGALFGSAAGAGTPSGNTVNVAAASNTVYVRSLEVKRYYRDNGGQCGACRVFCEPCLNNNMPAELLVEIEGCDETAALGGTCCGELDANGGLAGAFYIPISGCGGAIAFPLPAPRRLSAQFEDLGATARVTVEWYFQSNYPAAGEFVRWQASVAKPIDCANLDRLELGLVTGSMLNNCYGVMAAARCFVSAA